MLRLASNRVVGSLRRSVAPSTLARRSAGNTATSSSTTTPENASQTEQEKGASQPRQNGQATGPGADAQDEQPAEGSPDQLALELAKKDAVIAELNDRTLRALAEMENVRAIARRDVANARDFGITAFARGLLVVVDNLGLALRSVPEENLEKDIILRSLHTGVQATESELLKVFRQNGVQPFGAVGDEFDPHRHQALFEAPSDTAKPGTIVDVAKVGYSIGDRILRPAEVGVSKAPAETS